MHKSSIPSFFETLLTSERPTGDMELNQPPKPMGSWLDQAIGVAEGVIQSEVVSELGISG